jgi:hypothetical protein
MGLRKLEPCGQDLHLERKNIGNTKNTSVMNNESFKKACLQAGQEPTRRQASKWRQGRGRAFKYVAGLFNV